MRDIGFNFYWYDKYCKNIFAKGFEWNYSKDIEAVTCFEVFEHFINPLEDIENILNISKNVIFTTELLPSPLPQPNDWWYYALEEGQHISFYSEKTLRFIAKKYNLNYVFFKNIHLNYRKEYNKNIYKSYIFLIKNWST